MLKVYLAGSLDAKQHIVDLHSRIEEHDIEVTSRWLEMETGYQRDFAKLRRAAIVDWDDVYRSDVLVHCFTGIKSSGGGADSEVGIALALGKPVICYGERHNIFHWLPNVLVASTQERLMSGLIWASKTKLLHLQSLMDAIAAGIASCKEREVGHGSN